MAWADAWKLYAVHGVWVPGWIVETPEKITVRGIQQQQNVEIRRVMLERYGTARYIQDAGAKALDASDYGTLYRIEVADDEPIVMVRLVNSTPEPDGSAKEYWLRCEPELRPLLGTGADGQSVFGEPQALRARNAVAASFGLRGEEYEPAVQT